MMKNVFKKYSHQFPKCFEVARELVASTNVDLNMFELESITQFPSLSLYTSLMLIPSYSTIPITGAESHSFTTDGIDRENSLMNMHRA